MEYKIKYSSRRSIGAYTDKNGNVEIRCNYRTTQTQIDAFIKKYQIQIENMILKHKDFENSKPQLQIGSEIPYRGKNYKITERKTTLAGFDSTCFYLPFGVTKDNIAPLLEKIYIQLAKIYLIPRTKELSNKTGLFPTDIKISSAATRWGSCSSKNSINFSWRLMMASDSQIDYVIIHELCHIKEKNHSKQFWAEVEKYIPDFLAQREGLNKIRFW